MIRFSLHLASRFVLASTFFLILAGGLVTSTGSGLSVPDWPLSYGQYFPPMIGGIRFEHTHRVIAGFVALATLVLALLFYRKEKRLWVKRLSLLAFVAVIAQAVLGGITVLYYLPDAVSVLHACLAQTFFCLLAVLTLATSKEWLTTPRVEAPVANSLFRLLCATTVFIYLQLIAGAILRHSGNGLAMRFHLVLGVLVVLHVVLLIMKIAREDRVRPLLWDHALLIGLLTINQVFLGFASFIFTRRLEPSDIPRTGEVLFTAAHHTTGATILALALLLTLRARRLFIKKIAR